MLFARVAAATALCIMLPLLGTVALAKPAVVITLSQATVLTAADGTTHLVPLDGGVPVTRGAVIRYTISAHDTSTEAAQRLALTGHIPAGTAFYVGSVHGPGGHVEFSVDGTSFSARPMVETTTPAGKVMVAADPSAYVLVRWIKDGPLAAQSAIAFSYDVRLK